MNWNEIRDKIYYRDGSVRDIIILNTSAFDWKIWINYVNETYSVEWVNVFTDEIENKIDFNTIHEYWNGNLDFWLTTKIKLSKFLITTHFYEETKM